MFILTANYIDQIPSELKDRLEIIELHSYTLLEKCEIASQFDRFRRCKYAIIRNSNRGEFNEKL